MIDYKELQGMLLCGMPVQQIANHFRISRARVYQLIKKHNLDRTKPEKPRKTRTVDITMKITRTTKDGREFTKALRFKTAKLSVEIESTD